MPRRDARVELYRRKTKNTSLRANARRETGSENARSIQRRRFGTPARYAKAEIARRVPDGLGLRSMRIAQWVERLTMNQFVGGSSPPPSVVKAKACGSTPHCKWGAQASCNTAGAPAWCGAQACLRATEGKAPQRPGGPCRETHRERIAARKTTAGRDARHA